MALCQYCMDEIDVHIGINNIIAKDTSPKITYDATDCTRRSITDRLKLQLRRPARKATKRSGSGTSDSSSSGRYTYTGPDHRRQQTDSLESLSSEASARHKTTMDSPTIPGYFPLPGRSQTALGITRPSSGNGDQSPLEGSARRNTKQTTYRSTPRLTPSPQLSGSLTPSSSQHTPLQQSRSRLQRKRNPSKTEVDGIPPRVPPKNGAKASNKDKSSAAKFLSRSLPRTKFFETSHSSSTPNLSNPRGDHTSVKIEESERPSDQLSELPRFAQRHHDRRPKSLKILGLEAVNETDDPQMRDNEETPQDLVKKENSYSQPTGQKARGPLGTLGLPIGNLGPGYSVRTASMLLTCQEIEQLQSQARRKGQRFEILKYSEVSSLTQEMHTLNKHCKYLRETHVSLRADRQRLHGRVISYLKSASGVSNFSPEGVLKQEEALLEIEQSMDEWATKLEHAEERRAKIQQKLLEHMVAILNLPRTQSIQPPPREHGHHRSISDFASTSEKGSRRSDLESIIIYADAGLHRVGSANDRNWA